MYATSREQEQSTLPSEVLYRKSVDTEHRLSTTLVESDVFHLTFRLILLCIFALHQSPRQVHCTARAT